jgi:hypothetical protein
MNTEHILKKFNMMGQEGLLEKLPGKLNFG